jgi:hypothetical protein
MGFLGLSLCAAALLLMRQGMKPLTAEIVGSSMEPHLPGPRLQWSVDPQESPSRYAIDSLKPGMPLRSQFSQAIDRDFDWSQVAQQASATIDPGPRIRYNRLFRNQHDAYSSLRRGELIVVEPEESAQREVKRLIGFPGEQIEIRSGDIWIDGKRWSRSIREILEQSILLDSGDRSAASRWNYAHWSRSLSELNEVDGAPAILTTTSGGLICNDLRWNAHDSHTLVPVDDIGIAIQLDERSTSDWQLHIELHTSAAGAWPVLLERNENQLSISTPNSERSSIPLDSSFSGWIIAMRIDGQAIVGSQSEEWIRETWNDSTDDLSSSLEDDFAPVNIQCQKGQVGFQRWLLFRDIHYRGASDTDSQTLGPTTGFQLLGDNVSLSQDSRQRWPEGLLRESLRGVLLREESDRGLSALLNQNR